MRVHDLKPRAGRLCVTPALIIRTPQLGFCRYLQFHLAMVADLILIQSRNKRMCQPPVTVLAAAQRLFPIDVGLETEGWDKRTCTYL